MHQKLFLKKLETSPVNSIKSTSFFYSICKKNKNSAFRAVYQYDFPRNLWRKVSGDTLKKTLNSMGFLTRMRSLTKMGFLRTGFLARMGFLTQKNGKNQNQHFLDGSIFSNFVSGRKICFR